MKGYLLAFDQGTTSSRALLFDARGRVVSSAQLPFRQIYPKPGYVEHDPLEILATQFRAAEDCVAASGVSPKEIVALGITNQRETVVVWEKETGNPIAPAIVWQCRRTAAICDELKARGLEKTVQEKTGLRIDAYFSGTKIAWILDNVPGARERAEKGELLCGTIDSWLIWHLTGKDIHISDYSNCARTMLFDIHRLAWDEALCGLLNIPMAMLPRPVENSMVYGKVAADLPGLSSLAGIPISGAAGDQQAALFGQACFAAGQVKNTYGTGCFALMNTGSTPILSHNGLLTSVGWHLEGETTYILEGSVFNAGSTIQWLRDELGLIQSSRECDLLAESVPDSGGVFLVPAFTGLGAPHWDMYARGAILGLTRGAGKAHLCRAALEGIAYQTADLLLAMEGDFGGKIPSLRVDGGASVSDLMMQFQADLLEIPVERPPMVETTAWGAACLAGLAVGLWPDLTALGAGGAEPRVFTPARSRKDSFAAWHRAVERAKAWEEA